MNQWVIPEPNLKLLRKKRFNRADYELIDDLVVEFGQLNTNVYMKIVVPKGFVTDLASIPRFFWRVFPPSGEWAIAAIVHDYLYYCRYSRFFADATFRLLMQALKVKRFSTFCLYYAVRIFGGIAIKSIKQ